MKPPAEAKDKNQPRISVTPVYVAVQSLVQLHGTTAFFFCRGWTESLRVPDLPPGVEFRVVATPAILDKDTKEQAPLPVDLGSSVQGVWRADNSSISEQIRRATHTTLMSLVIPQQLRASLINLGGYGRIELVFSSVVVPATHTVQQLAFLPLLTGALTPLFTAHNTVALTPEKVAELIAADPFHLPAVVVKRRYVYPPVLPAAAATV